MKVGDVVTDVDGWLGIVVDYHAMGKHIVMVLWSDGLFEHCDVSFLELISEAG